MKLFVYGTLKYGYCNHHWLGDAARLGEGTVFGLRLHKGPGFPYAYKVNDYTQHTHGELYEIDTLDNTDRLEGYPNHYTRSEVEVDSVIGKVKAWVYHSPVLPRGDVIPSGIW